VQHDIPTNLPVINCHGTISKASLELFKGFENLFDVNAICWLTFLKA